MRVLMTKRAMLISFFALIVILLYTASNVTNSESKPNNYIVIYYEDKESSTSKVNKEEKDNPTELKYILQWTSPRNVPFMFMGKGQQGFIDKKCPYTNCFVTADRKYLGGDITKFDVIAFAGPEVVRMSDKSLPEKRSPHQKYAFASIESSDYYPACSKRFDGYFNWTWTFRLDSEVKWGYFVIRDKDNKVVGPKKDMQWIKFEDMDPVSTELKEKLNMKTNAVAWFVSNCHSRSKREKLAKKLQEELKQFGHTVDIYGKCGPLKCSRGDDSCLKLITEKYYFYLSFENSFSEDYVTEKLLNAVQNYAVPIVYGAANYTRFLPFNSYLNARELEPADLARKINELIKHPEEYYEYFRWTKYYSYYRKMDSVETDEYCLFCTTLNDERLVKERKVYQHFREWWDPPGRC